MQASIKGYQGMAQELGMGIDLRISPAFHPQSIAGMAEFDEDTRQDLQLRLCLRL